jgi:hypothetical protein
VCAEEGLLTGEAATQPERARLRACAANAFANVAVKTFPPRVRLPLRSRADFVARVFWPALRRGDLIVGFNLPFDLARLAVKWGPARNGGWSLVLSLRRSQKTSRIEPNPHRPRIRITARNSQSAFIALTPPAYGRDEWPRAGRFLDLHTLALALFDQVFSPQVVRRSP